MKTPALLTATLFVSALLDGAAASPPRPAARPTPAALPAAAAVPSPAPPAGADRTPAPAEGAFPAPDGAVPLSALPETARQLLETSFSGAAGVPVAAFVPQQQSVGPAPPNEVFAARNLTPEAGVRLSADQFAVIGRQLALQVDPDLTPHRSPQPLERIRAFLRDAAQTQSILEVDLSDAGVAKLASGQGAIRLLRLERLPAAGGADARPLVLTAAEYLFYGGGKVLLLSHSLPYETAKSLEAARWPLAAWAKRVQASGFPL